MDNNGNYTDADLLNAFQLVKPPDQAIRHLYRTCFLMARSYVLQNSGNEQDAEDIFQESVISLIEMVRNGKFRGESSISSCLYSITRHLWLNELRRKGRALKREARFDRENFSPEPDLDKLLGGEKLRAQLMQMIEALGENCKKILVAFYYDDLPMKEIMGLVNYQNEQVLRNKKYKCMKQLEEALTGKLPLLQYFKSALYHE
ncbi:MAG TPA: sigma-70 family RNA polymerase sigma factor [Puia sp.]|jgi:RNA polymerase sigma factor (sigma-70 family)|nr:sigma-70 family RNA polymerase sigma factor [Puia sp.]